MSYEGRYHLLFKRKIEIQEKDEEKEKKRKSLANDLAKINFEERKHEIHKLEYNITQLKNELIEAI